MNIIVRAFAGIGRSALLLIGVFVAVGAIFLFPHWSNANALGYKLATLDRGPIVSTVTATGTVNPITTVIVGSQLSGQLVEILADYNDRVTAGQILARLNSDQIRFKRDAAKADLDQARATQVMQEAKMAEAELTFSRQVRLKPTGAVSDASYDAARTTARVAKAQLEVNAARIDQMEAVLHQVEVDLANTDIRSPVNGVIIQRSVELGQTVAASLQSPTIFTIADDLRRMEIAVSIDETDVGRVKPGQRVAFSVSASRARVRGQGQACQARVTDHLQCSHLHGNRFDREPKDGAASRHDGECQDRNRFAIRRTSCAERSAPLETRGSGCQGTRCLGARTGWSSPDDTGPAWLGRRQRNGDYRYGTGPRDHRGQEAVIRTENLSRHFQLGEQVTALEGVTVSIDAGEYVAITGPSGSGKSTFMGIVGCLDRPTRGKCWIDGVETSDLGSDDLAAIRNRKIGFVFQNFNLLDRLNARENIELPLMYAGVQRRARTEIADTALSMVGLADRRNHLPSQLSGGQQQRVAVARALACSPSIILADEPTGALDSRSANEMMTLFRKLNDFGKTIVVVTHDPQIAQHASRVIRFFDGRVL